MFAVCVFTGSGTDFNSSTVEVEFRRRTMGRNVIIPIIDDDIHEPLENFSLAIELDPQLSNMGVIIGEPAVATGFIIDDDEGMNSMCYVSQLQNGYTVCKETWFSNNELIPFVLCLLW